MIDKIRTHLKQPFPLEQPAKWAVLSAFGAGLFVAMFLIIFQPFGTDTYVREGRIWILWGYGAVTVLALLIDTLALPQIFPRIFKEEKWNLLKGMGFQFWHIASIGTANMLYDRFIGGKELSFVSFLSFLLTALAVGFFPITIGVLSFYIYLFQKYSESSKKMTERLTSRDNRGEAAAVSSQTIVISAETGKEKIELDSKKLLFIKSVDNYVEVNWAHNGQIKTSLLRNSLKQIEENLKAYPYLFRCHRTYLVNVTNISRITGNSRGYKLGFKGLEEAIPVSRNYVKKFTQLITS